MRTRLIGLIALTPFTDAAGAFHAPGEVFEAPPLQAVLLLNRRTVRLAPKVSQREEKPKKRTYRRRDMTAEQP